MHGGRYRIGDLLLDVGTQQVTREHVEIPLTRLSFNLLLALARTAPEILTIDELEHEVWPGLVVEPDTVGKRVRILRDALGDDSHHPRYVAVVRGRGYRLVAPVERLDSGRPEGRDTSSYDAPSASASLPSSRWPRRTTLGMWAGAFLALAVIAAIGALQDSGQGDDPALTAAGHPAVSVAVLPLANASGDPEQDFLASGITDELRYRLGQIPSLRVISRRSSSMLRDKTAGREALAARLEVDYLLDGKLRSSADRVRVTIELVDAARDSLVLAQRYEHELEDIFVIQDEIAQSVADSLSLRFLSAAPAPWGKTTPESHMLYLRGRHQLRKRTVESAEHATRLFQEALEIDPDNARAYTGQALGLLWHASFGDGPARQSRQQAAALARRAIALEPMLAEGHAVLGLSLAPGEAQEAAYRRAIALNPSDADTYHWLCLDLGNRGRLHEAHEASQRARALDPLNPIMIGQSAWMLSHLGRHDEARARLVEALTYVSDARWIYNYLASLENAVGRPDRALRWYFQIPAGSAPEAWPFAEALMELGRLAEAEAMMEEDLSRWPNNRWTAHKRAVLRWASRDFAAMDSIMEQALAEMPPGDNAARQMDDRLTLWFAAIAKIHLGEYGQATALMEQARTPGGFLLHEPNLTLFFWVDLAYAHLKAGDHAAAHAALDEGIKLAASYERAGFRQAWLPFATGLLYAMDGRTNAAMQQLDEAYRRGWRHIRVHDRRYVLEDFVAEPVRTSFLSRIEADLQSMSGRVADAGTKRALH